MQRKGSLIIDHFKKNGQKNMDVQNRKTMLFVISVVKVLCVTHLVYKHNLTLNTIPILTAQKRKVKPSKKIFLV